MRVLPPNRCIGAIALVVLSGLTFPTGVKAQPPAARNAVPSDRPFGEILCRGSNQFGDNLFRLGIPEFGKSYPALVVRYDWASDPVMKVAGDLAERELDVALLMGPIFRPHTTQDGPGSARRDHLMELLTNAQCDFTVIGRNAMAVVVHPQNPLQEMDQAQAEAILLRKVTSWKALHQEDRLIRVLGDRRASLIMLECIGTSFITLRNRSNVSEGLEQLARDPSAIGFISIDKWLAASGLKILPIRPIGGQGAVLPSPDNVASGRYPFSGYLLLACRPRASAPVLALKKTLANPEYVSQWYRWWLPTLDYTLPGEAQEEVWPIPDEDAPAPDVSGAVAVLPLEPLSATFLMAGPAEYAAYEQAVADGIAKDGRLNMVNRSDLAKLIQERRVRLIHGTAQAPQAVLTADVLVHPCVITIDSRSYLLVRAIHSATISCLGQMKLPIDPAQPEQFLASVTPTTARWWPGVLRNLASVVQRPVWTLVPPVLPVVEASQMTDADRALLHRIGEVRASLEEILLAEPRVVFAQPDLIPDAQREVLMGLMGISRPAGGRFAPMADYVLRGDVLGEGAIRLQVLRGSDLQLFRETILKPSDPPAAAGSWIVAQLADLADHPPRQVETARATIYSTAAAQAALELEQIPELRRQFEALRHAAYERARRAGRWNDPTKYLPEDQAELERRKKEIDRRYRRAAHLDPTCEATAYEAAVAATKDRHDQTGHYERSRRTAEIFSRFLDTFPDSKYAEELTMDASYAFSVMARYLGDRRYHRSGSYEDIPRGLDRPRLIREYRQRQLIYAIRYLELVCSATPEPRDPEQAVQWLQRSVEEHVAANLPEHECAEAAFHYGEALDRFPHIVPPSDFLRLRYLAARKEKAAFVDLLSAMQHRRPDPNDVYWKIGRDQVLADLSELLQVDPPATSFHRWLCSCPGIGTMPLQSHDSTGANQ